MPKVKISEYSATANSNTDVASINIDEGCAPSGINNAIRAVMGHLKDFQQGTYGDPFNGPVNGTLGATTASTANVTTLTTSSTVTHNGGTANGVAYLNGSKALTTGSALVFDGTNLGVGVTPSAWQSGIKVLQIGSYSSLGFDGANSTFLGNNWTYSSATYKYINDGPATYYTQTGTGQHQWYNAPSGTANVAFTFTKAMTLNANGVLALQGASTSANGVGITFPATQSASSDANTLDDYEEGTFTPTAVGSTTAGTGTYGTQTGVYTKIGRFVHAYIGIDWSAHTGTGNLRISGLPFGGATQTEIASMFANGLTYTGTHLQPFCVGTEIWLNQTSSGAGDSYIPMDTNCQLGFTIVYYV